MPNYNIPQGETYPLGLDYAGGRISGDTIQNRSPYSFVVRYLSDGGSSLPGKLLLPGEAGDLLAHDVAIMSNWETTADMMLRGYQGGGFDARAAWTWHKQCGGPDNATVYFSCDFDANEQQQGAINEYIRACIDYLGLQSVGIYGGYYVCKRAREAFPGLKVWQTLAWSGGQILDNIELFQRIGFRTVDGVQCDVNELRKPGKAGAWQDVTEPTTVEEIMGQVRSLIDGKDYSTEQMIAFIDYHVFRIDKLLTQQAKDSGKPFEDGKL